MKLNVLFFASLREDVGCESVALELASGSFAELRSVLIERLGAQRCEALWAENVRIARNQALVSGPVSEQAFADGDELAFLPPVTGG